MLQPSEGVVSIAATGHPVGAAGGPAPAAKAGGGGASTLFWIICLMSGIAVGALAYVVVLQL
jgi:hypothetical protein